MQQERDNEWEAMKDKSQSTVSTLSILIAATTLFLAVILQRDACSAYQSCLHEADVICGVLTIVCMVLAIDILDTVSNLFIPDKYKDKASGRPLNMSKYFYDDVGAVLPKGGISYAYHGCAIFSVFVIISVAFFRPLYAGIGVAFYMYLGYPFWFGYWGKEYKTKKGDSGERLARVEIDPCHRYPSYVLVAFFLLGTLAAENVAVIMHAVRAMLRLFSVMLTSFSVL